MDEAVHHFVDETGWRLRTLLRTQRYHDSKNLIRLYKCHILSFLEGVTPALYHASPSVLRPLDGLQNSFWEKMVYRIKTLFFSTKTLNDHYQCTLIQAILV